MVTIEELADVRVGACWEALALAVVAAGGEPLRRGLPGVLGTLERAAPATWTFDLEDDDECTESWTIAVPFPDVDRGLAALVRGAGGGARLAVFATGWDDSDERLLIAAWSDGDPDGNRNGNGDATGNGTPDSDRRDGNGNGNGDGNSDGNGMDAEAALYRVVVWHDDAPSVERADPETARGWLERGVPAIVRSGRDDRTRATCGFAGELRARLAEAAGPHERPWSRLLRDEDVVDGDLPPEAVEPFETIRAYLREDDVELRRLGIADLTKQLGEESRPTEMTQLIHTAELGIRDADTRVRVLAVESLEALDVPALDRRVTSRGREPLSAWPRGVPGETVEAIVGAGLADRDAAVRAATYGTAAWLDGTCAAQVSPIRRLQREAVAVASEVGYADADRHVEKLETESDASALAQLLVLRERGGNIAPSAREAVEAALWLRFPLAVWARLRRHALDGAILVAMSRHATRDPEAIVRRVVEALASDRRASLDAARVLKWPDGMPTAIVDALRVTMSDTRRCMATHVVLAPMWIDAVGLAAAGGVMLRFIESGDESARSAAAALASRDPAAEVAWRWDVLERAAYDQARSVRDCAARSLQTLEQAGQRAGWITGALAACGFAK